MNNQDRDTRFQRYDFTPKRSQVKRKRRPHIWPWILGLVIVVLILTFGIRYVLNNSQQVSNQAPKTPVTAKKINSSNANVNNSKTSKSQSKSTTNEAPISEPAKNESPSSETDDDAGFAEPHIFNSLQDAKNWANATKSDWTAVGYNYWTVNQNSQGYYVLTFTK